MFIDELDPPPPQPASSKAMLNAETNGVIVCFCELSLSKVYRSQFKLKSQNL